MANTDQILKSAVESALQTGKIGLHFQPIFCVAENAFTKAEALIRLNGPDNRPLPANEVISFAEKRGYINKLGLAVLEEACRFFTSDGKGLRYFSVNASAKQLGEAGFAEQVTEMLQAYGIPPQSLFIELTESMRCQQFKQLEANMRRLRDCGVHISLDDFGKGFADIRSLTYLPISAVKIDKCYISRAETTAATLLIRGLTGLCRRMGLSVIAEGVETSRQKRLLENLNCDYLQGYYLSRPLPPDVFAEFMKANKLSAKVAAVN